MAPLRLEARVSDGVKREGQNGISQSKAIDVTLCRFEDRLAGEAKVLSGLRQRITACSATELPAAFAAIEAAQRAGYWIALMLDYELGEWFEPALQTTAGAAQTQLPTPSSVSQTDLNPHSRLTALVFDSIVVEKPWDHSRPDSAAARACITSVTASLLRADYFDRIQKIKEWIAQGEVYQINSTFALNVSTQGSAQELYRQLANQHPSAHAAFIEDAEQTVLSFSPELFLQRRGTTLITRPMKGTAPRSNDPLEDQRLGQGLQASAKDRAENLMIVDLLRNDLGRIATPGTVIAAPLFSLEAYPSVWTMTSTIQAIIATNTSLETILRALFPCGSITGAPKIAAMKRIQQTEAQARGLYCGSLGWLAPNGDFSLNVAIRTLLLKQDGSGLYHVGGGIVHDSVAALEWDECHWKARIVIDRPELAQPQPHPNLALPRSE
ncbi:MAG: aminodeoxychorismate synthase, component I [Alcaligenaceae bacterium]|nr:MAG: aminodeoxychorismate synthase, component I [Alcaligenaceae bacterium]